MATVIATVMCGCSEFKNTWGCFEHSTRNPELVMAFQLGFVDGNTGSMTDFIRPFTTWPADEQDFYDAGWAVATGRSRRKVGA